MAGGGSPGRLQRFGWHPTPHEAQIGELGTPAKPWRRERTRIAKDIHDDLGASLTRISMISQSARGMDDLTSALPAISIRFFLLPANQPAPWADTRLGGQSLDHDTFDSLATYLQKFAQNFLRDANVRCRIDMPLELPLWPLTADIRHNLLLAFKEAINNVVRHANASEVRISLKVGELQSFTLTIEDNGCGFKVPAYLSTVAAAPEHPSVTNGLRNMSRRLAETGGRFEIVSTEGAGTKVIFVVLLMAA